MIFSTKAIQGLQSSSPFPYEKEAESLTSSLVLLKAGL